MKCLSLFITLALLAVPAMASNALVSSDWLMQKLDDPKVRIIEVSVDTAVYDRGHVPGAVNFPWHTHLADTVRRDIVPKERFEKLLSDAGIRSDTTVVLYGDHNNWFAGWALWIFDVYGHENVKILDGGRKKWEADKRPLTADVPTFAPTDYRVRRTNNALRARLSDVLAIVDGKANGALVDVRSADEFSGKSFAPAGIQELAIRAGHIPGAKNIPWSKTVNADDGTFKPVEELKKLYAEAGIDGTKPIITYCRIGERSSHTWFVLKHLLGYDVRNYDGSWTEYGNAVGVPIANPSGTVWTGK